MHGKRLAIITGIVLLGWFGSALAADLKVACVDINKAINECNLGKESKKTIAKEAEKLYRQSMEKQKELQALREAYDKQALMLTPDARATKEKEIQHKLREFQRWQEDAQNDFNQKRTDTERNLYLGLQKVIQKMGADEGYTFILERNESLVLYATKVIDITDRVIKIFDAQKK
jgi:outer membrane protein